MARSSCSGLTSRGVPCRNPVAAGRGWCGRCAAPPASAVTAAVAPGLGPLPEPEPLGVDRVWHEEGDDLMWMTSVESPSGVIFGATVTRSGHDGTYHWDAEVEVGGDSYLGFAGGDTDDRDTAAAAAADVVGRVIAAADPGTSPAVLSALACSGDTDTWGGRLAAALHPSTPHSDLETLTRDQVQLVRCAAAANRATPAAALSAIAARRFAGPDETDHAAYWFGVEAAVNEAVAANPTTPTADVARYADDPQLARYAAQNPACPPGLIDRVARHGPDGASAAATNPSCPKETLVWLSTHPDREVRASASANPNCPGHARAAAGLLNDDDTHGADPF